jgi:integrase
LAPAIRRVNKKAIEAKLDPPIQANGRRLTVHGLRHTWNTALRRLLPEEMLRALMGHHSERMSDLYDHPQVAEQVKALEPARKEIERVFEW